jgi:hypothetical protein
MFALINIGQTSLQAPLATGVRTGQYEWAASSVFANSGIFVFAVLSFAGFASFADDRRPNDFAVLVVAAPRSAGRCNVRVAYLGVVCPISVSTFAARAQSSTRHAA